MRTVGWTKVSLSLFVILAAACSGAAGLDDYDSATWPERDAVRPESTPLDGTAEDVPVLPDGAGGEDTDGPDPQVCSACHGSAANAAPPRAMDGATATTVRGVGAHQAHLRASDWRGPIACSECHTVPAAADSPGHADTSLPAELVWGALATADGARPAFDGARCASTYCHGGTLAGGGTNQAPAWTVVDGSEAACGTCHALPPAAPHPTSSACGECHPTMSAGLEFAEPARHIDGIVDVATDLACDACHGSGGNPAPPTDLAGNDATTARGVGAHRAHLTDASWHAPLSCHECHAVPLTSDAPGHADTPLPAELVWGTRATTAGAAPTFDGERCASTYCHGGTLDAGGTVTDPQWTVVDGTQADCDACHGNPPPPPHTASAACGQCHPNFDDIGRVADGSRHIDGVLDVALLGCDGCHGGNGNPAPPLDLAGNDSTTQRGVGAHRAHLGASDWRAPIACSECHTVPTTTDAPGHADTAGPAELVWGAVATAKGARPQWDGERCVSTYCHGGTLPPSGTLTRPAWTVVDGSQAACGTCHGNPPEGHPPTPNCGRCHPNSDANGRITDPSKHVDGTVDLVGEIACDACHGSDGNPAPPVDVAGASETTVRGVGAHRAHLGVSDWHAPIACSECHTVPETLEAAGHADTPTPAELVWGPRATADGAVPTWDGARCASTYCHGGTLLPGGASTEPEWTLVNGTQAACGTCHGLPPAGGHPPSTACEQCHGDVVRADRTFANAALHIDGTVQVVSGHPAGYVMPSRHGADFNAQGPAACTACHGTALDGGTSGTSCDDCHAGWQTRCTFCHGGTDNETGAPPLGVGGESARTDLAVGAHTAHVAATGTHVAWSCTTCHPDATSALSAGHIDGDGRAEVVFAAPSASGTYAGATGTCATSYCHGNGRSAGSAVWTSDPTLTCDSCHPASGLRGRHDTHLDEGFGCETCHNDVASSSTAIRPTGLALHVNGAKDVRIVGVGNWNPAEGRCSSIACHGAEDW